MPLAAQRRVLSDDEMSNLETAGADSPSKAGSSAPAPRATAAKQPRVLNDDEMERLEASQAPQDPSAARAAAAKGIGGSFLKTVLPQLGIVDALGGSSDAVALGAVDTGTLGNARYSKTFSDALDKARAGYPKSVIGGQVAGMAPAALGAMAAPEAVIPRLGVNATPVLAAAAQGLASKPQNEGNEIGDRVNQAKASALLAGLIQGGGNLASNTGGWLMNKAIGAKDEIAAMGKKIADEGLWGTKGMMQGQVAEKLPGAIADTDAAAAQIPGRMTPYPSAKAVSEAIKRKLPTATGLPGSSMPQNQAMADAGADRLGGIVQRPNLTAPEALDASRKIGGVAYADGDPLSGFKNDLNRADAGAMKDVLKNASSGVRSGLDREATLYTAKNGLSSPMNASDYLRFAGRVGTGAALGAGLGEAGGGHEGAGAGMLAGAVAATPLGQSLAAQALVQGSKAMNPATTSAIISEYLRKKGAKK